MIIGIDASRANNGEKTGVEWYAFFLIQELKKIIPSSDKVILYSREALRDELSVLPPNWSQKVLSWPPKRLWTQIRLSLEMLIHAPDVLFIPAHVAPVIHSKRAVAVIHDIAALRYPECYNWFERWYSLWFARYAGKHLWRIITPSEFTKTELVNGAYAASGNVYSVKHGFDKKYRVISDAAAIREVLAKYGIRQPYILSVGRLERKKNTAGIVKAFEKIKLDNPARLEDLRLVLAGKAGFGFEKIQELILKSPCKKDIILPGWISENDLPAIVNGANVFIFPSFYEGFGLPVLEAMACGAPVICSNNSSLKEIGGDAAVYIDPENIGELAAKMNHLLIDENLRKEKIARGLEQAKKFSWEKCAEETLKVICGN